MEQEEVGRAHAQGAQGAQGVQGGHGKAAWESVKGREVDSATGPVAAPGQGSGAWPPLYPSIQPWAPLLGPASQNPTDAPVSGQLGWRGLPVSCPEQRWRAGEGRRGGVWSGSPWLGPGGAQGHGANGPWGRSAQLRYRGRGAAPLSIQAPRDPGACFHANRWEAVGAGSLRPSRAACSVCGAGGHTVLGGGSTLPEAAPPPEQPGCHGAPEPAWGSGDLLPNLALILATGGPGHGSPGCCAAPRSSCGLGRAAAGPSGCWPSVWPEPLPWAPSRAPSELPGTPAAPAPEVVRISD